MIKINKNILTNINFIKFYVYIKILGYDINFSIKELKDLSYIIINWYEKKYANTNFQNLNNMELAKIKEKNYNELIDILSQKELNLLNNYYYTDPNKIKIKDYINIKSRDANYLLIFNNNGIVEQKNIEPFFKYIGNFNTNFTVEKLFFALNNQRQKNLNLNELEDLINTHRINKHLKLFVLNYAYEFLQNNKLNKESSILLKDFNIDLNDYNNKLKVKRKKYQTKN